MKELVKVEIELPVLPAGYEYAGEFRQAERGEYLNEGFKAPCQWGSDSPTPQCWHIIKKTIKIIDPFDSSGDIDLEFSNGGGRWFCLPRSEACKHSNKYLFSNLGNLSFSRCRVRRNHRFVCAEGTRLPAGIRCLVRNSRTKDVSGWTSSGDPYGDCRVNIEFQGVADGYKYEWE